MCAHMVVLSGLVKLCGSQKDIETERASERLKMSFLRDIRLNIYIQNYLLDRL